MNKSRLVLGTAQLGMRYGLSNTIGKPEKNDAFDILDSALAGGINTFDTAFAYGNAEEILGEWIEGRSLQDKVFVISKMRPHALRSHSSDRKAEEVVIHELHASLRRLRLPSIDGYLFHTPSYIYNAALVAGLHMAKKLGLVSHVGVSIYEEEEALRACDVQIDYLQVPFNTLDQRFSRGVFSEIVAHSGVKVFARSPFLQGLLLMNPGSIPPHLEKARPYIEKFQDRARKQELSPAAAALQFAYLYSKAEHIVFGAESVSQVRDNIKAVAEARESLWMDDLEKDFKEMDKAIVNPSLWTNPRQ